MENKDYEQKKRECWEEFKNEVFNGNISYSPYGGFDFTFDRAYTIGKQETKQETKPFGISEQLNAEDTVIQGWLVRDKDGTLNLFYGSDKPIKRGQDEYWSVVAGAVFEYLPREMFPDLIWESDPIEVEIQIKIKKNG